MFRRYLAATVIAVALLPAAAYANNDGSNSVSYWCVGGLGVKYEPVNTPFIVPAPPTGYVWTLLVLKAGSGPDENATYPFPVVGQAYSHPSGHDVSHAILCKQAASTTTTEVTTSTSSTTTTESPTTSESPTTTPAPTTTSSTLPPATTSVPTTDAGSTSTTTAPATTVPAPSTSTTTSPSTEPSTSSSTSTPTTSTTLVTPTTTPPSVPSTTPPSVPSTTQPPASSTTFPLIPPETGCLYPNCEPPTSTPTRCTSNTADTTTENTSNQPGTPSSPPCTLLPATGTNPWLVVFAGWFILSIGAALTWGAMCRKRDEL